MQAQPSLKVTVSAGDDRLTLSKQEVRVAVEYLEEILRDWKKDRDEINWRDVIDSKETHRFTIRQLMTAQRAQDVDVEKMIPKFLEEVASRKMDGSARQCLVETNLTTHLEQFLRDPHIVRWISKYIPRRCDGFDLKQSQILFIAYNVFHDMLEVETPYVRVLYDGGDGCKSEKKTTDTVPVRVAARATTTGSGAMFANLPTGTGKTVMVVVSMIMRLMCPKIWTWLQDNQDHLIARAVSKCGAQGPFFESRMNKFMDH